MIPAFNEKGWLPEGIHDCVLDEAAERFGRFQSSDRRPRLWAQFLSFIDEAKACNVIEGLILDGSFVTDTPSPNDIDMVVVVPASHDFGSDLRPLQYNVLSQRRVRSRFGFDILVVKNGSENLDHVTEFFQQVKERPGEKKGVVRITL